MNTYYKFCPNVFLAKCEEEYEKGDIVEVVSKYGKENKNIVHNLIMKKDGFYFYSITRADGFSTQERAKAKKERYKNWAGLAQNKSNDYVKASQEGKDFLVLGEPVKLGHHSEKRHRALLDRNWKRMEKATKLEDKADEHERKANYWESKENVINLSMPESIEFFLYKLEKAKEYHAGLKSGKYEREHSYSLTYAKKDVNEFQKKYDTAVFLWGDK